MGVISDKKFIKGMDVSSLPELEQLGAKFYDKDGVHCTISENITTHGLLHKVIEENF